MSPSPRGLAGLGLAVLFGRSLGVWRRAESTAKAAVVVGGRPAPFGRRPRSSLAGFLLAKCLRQKLCRPLETRLSAPSCPFTDAQKPARRSDSVPARLPMGPIPLRLFSHLPGSLGSSAGGNQPLPPPVFPTLPASPLLVITSTAAPLIYFF